MSDDPNQESKYDVLPAAEMREKYGLTIENSPRKKLNPHNVPESLRTLTPVAEQWGISDDIVREDVLRAASRDELQGLVDAVAKFSDDAFDNWLAGPEAKGPTYSPEYIAFSDLRDAFDNAKWMLDNWNSWHTPK